MQSVVVVVCDEKSFVDSFSTVLEQQGKEVLKFYSITQSMSAYADKRCSLFVLGVDELKESNIKLIENLRIIGYAPIFVSYEKADEEQRIASMEKGATECVDRACSAYECAAMIDALIRVYSARAGEEKGMILSFKNGLVINALNWSVWIDGSPIKLTRREFLALRCLAQNKNRILSRKEIYRSVWQTKDDYEIDGSVKALIKSLRKKIGDRGCRIIQNVRGVGYRIMEDD